MIAALAIAVSVLVFLLGYATLLILEQRATINSLGFALSDLRAQVVRGKKLMAPFDHDGNGAPGGSKPR